MVAWLCWWWYESRTGSCKDREHWATPKRTTNYGDDWDAAKETSRKEQLTAEEADLIKTLERLKGRKLTEQEINLSLDQARAIGEL